VLATSSNACSTLVQCITWHPGHNAYSVAKRKFKHGFLSQMTSYDEASTTHQSLQRGGPNRPGTGGTNKPIAVIECAAAAEEVTAIHTDPSNSYLLTGDSAGHLRVWQGITLVHFSPQPEPFMSPQLYRNLME
jgi:hypothetical protein